MQNDQSSKIHGVKGIIKSSHHKNKYLLAIHNNIDPENIGKWTFLGGWIDEIDQSFADTLRRELLEELDLQLNIEKEIGAFEYKRKNRIYMIMSATALNDPNIVSDEIVKIDWFTYKEIIDIDKKNLLHTGFEVQAIEKYISLRK